MIYSFWHTLDGSKPDVVVRCEAQAKTVFGEEFLQLNKAMGDDVMERNLSYDFAHLPIQVYADLLRLFLLLEKGGTWIDATVWVEDPTAKVFRAPGEHVHFIETPNRRRVGGNWLMTAPADDPLIAKLSADYAEYWRQARLPMRDAGMLRRLAVQLANKVSPETLISPNILTAGGRYFPYFAQHYHLNRLVASGGYAYSVIDYDYGDAACAFRKLSWK